MKKKQISIKDIELIFEGKRISLNLFSCDKRKTKQQRREEIGNERSSVVSTPIFDNIANYFLKLQSFRE